MTFLDHFNQLQWGELKMTIHSQTAADVENAPAQHQTEPSAVSGSDIPCSRALPGSHGAKKQAADPTTVRQYFAALYSHSISPTSAPISALTVVSVSVTKFAGKP